MSPLIQEIIVGVVIAIAVVGCIVRIVRRKPNDCGCGCTDCPVKADCRSRGTQAHDHSSQ